MNPKSGSAGSAVSPTDPGVATDADNADPGKVAEVKREQRETESGKYGSEQVEAYKPPESTDETTELTWIEVELLEEDTGDPVPGERYVIEFPDGRVHTGTLDQDGVDRVENVEPGSVRISFPDLDEREWEPGS